MDKFNERYNQIIDEAYKNYKRITHHKNEKNGNWGEYSRWGDNPLIAGVQHLTKSSFIQMCKIDSEFSERCRLKIEERELSLDERHTIAFPIWKEKYGALAEMMVKTNVDNTPYNIPTKLITVTYKDEKIEVYE